MDNKKYLDKVIGSLVRGTNIDYENNRIIFPFDFTYAISLYTLYDGFESFTPSLFHSFFPFSPYCKNMFGLTEEEIEYVWNEFKEIILDKINNGE